MLGLRRSGKTCLLLPCFAALVAACSGSPQPPASQPTKPAPSASATAAAAPTSSAASSACVIDGTLRDDKGVPVAGALVAAVAPFTDKEAARILTREGGGFCFEGVPAGEYGLTVTSPSVTAAYVDVFKAGGDKGHGIEVKAGGQGFVMRGRVVDESGRSIGKRVLHIRRLSKFTADVFVVESGDDGAFTVKLPGDEYRMTVESEDAAGVRENFRLDSDTTGNITTTRINPRSQPPPAEVVAWIKSKAVKLSSPEAGKGLDEMEPLRAVVGGARVVGLGEATHGTRELIQMKHRMLEFLVEKMGFRALVMEGSFSDALAVDEYIRTGKGDPHAAVASMRSWTWDTEEIVAMVQWMRGYNEDSSHKEKLRFFGVDTQFPAGSAAAVAAALKEIDKKLLGEASKGLEALDDDWEAANFGDAPRAVQDAAEAAAKKVVARFDEQRESDIKKLKAEPFALARLHAHAIADYIEWIKKRGSEAGVRDRIVSDSLFRVLNFLGSGAKVALWAHNGHVQRRGSAQQQSLGSLLSRKLGKDYVAFGFAFDQGSFQAIDTNAGLKETAVGAAPPGSLDGALASAELPLFALDLRPAAGTVGTWLHTPTTLRTIGAVYNAAIPDSFFDLAPPADLYDALFFVGKTSAAHPTATGKGFGASVDIPVLPALTNAGFEDGTDGQPPPSWQIQSEPLSFHYRAKVVSKGSSGGKRSILIEREPSPLPVGLGSFGQRIDAKPLHGKRVKVAAKLKVKGKKIGDEAFVYVSIRTGKGAPKTLWERAPSNKDWREVAVEADVPADAEALGVGVVVAGAASVGVDEFTVAPVEKK